MRLILILTGALCALGACTDPVVLPTAALNGPTMMEVARGDVCMDIRQVTDEGLLAFETRACAISGGDENAQPREVIKERGAIGLVPNMQANTVSVVGLALNTPSLLDVNPKIPGVTSIDVGQTPVDVAASKDGRTAYVANQVDRTLSVVNLWAMKALDVTLPLPGVPKSVETFDEDQVMVVLANPSSLYFRSIYDCKAPSFPIDFTTYNPNGDCQERFDPAKELTYNLSGVVKRVVLDPRRPRAYVLYDGAPTLSVVALPGSTEACGDGSAEAPCEIKRIALRASCSDGLDSDGDGLVDQDDPQCFGPGDSEDPTQPDVLGRRALKDDCEGDATQCVSTCVNGIDDDMDGVLDHEDPDCVSPSSDENSTVEELLRLPECADGRDNDGDGVFDSNDPGCYGTYGATEKSVESGSFVDIGIDEIGAFLYVAETTQRQVLIVDLMRDVLLDAARQVEPVDPFTERLGVSVGLISTPTAVTGRVLRRFERDPDPVQAGRHGIVRYDYGAHVTADSGVVYFVQTATVYCDLREGGPYGLLSSEQFYNDPEALLQSDEIRCLELPEFSTIKSTNKVDSCTSVFQCQACLEDPLKGSFRSCQDEQECFGVEEMNFTSALQGCNLPERTLDKGLVRQVVNPLFDVRDRNSLAAGQLGRAVCEQPTKLLESMQNFLQSNANAADTLDCGSALMPQPLSPLIRTEGRSASFDAEARINVLEKSFVALEFGDTGLVEKEITVSATDYRIRDESVVVVYEGVLPGTRREDGEVEQEQGVFSLGGLNPCATDVREGDRLTIVTGPGTETGGVSDACNPFEAPATASEEVSEAFLTYEVTKVSPDRVTLAVIPDSPFAQTLPVRSCFPRGLTYEIRPHQEWLVYGEQSGVASSRELGLTGCVPRKGQDSIRANSRVKTGELFKGPYFDMQLYEGKVDPVQGLRFTFTVDRNFLSAADPTGLGLSSQSIRLSNVGMFNLFLYREAEVQNYTPMDELAPRAQNRLVLWSIDTSDNALFIKNLSSNLDPVTLR